MQGNNMATLSNPAERFYADLSPREQQHWIEQLIPNAVKVMVTPVSNDRMNADTCLFDIRKNVILSDRTDDSFSSLLTPDPDKPLGVLILPYDLHLLRRRSGDTIWDTETNGGKGEKSGY
jgi:hypothetical protein